MKPTWFISIIFLFLIPAIHGCANKEEQAVEASKERGGDVASEEITAIKKTVTDFAKAMTNFPRTRDKGSVLKFGTKDYVEITDGEMDNAQGIDKYLSELLKQINLGDPIGISYEVANIDAHVAGTIAWATYQYSYKLGRGGLALDEKEGMCTAIFKKEGKVWLYQHEHCSSLSPLPRLKKQK